MVPSDRVILLPMQEHVIIVRRKVVASKSIEKIRKRQQILLSALSSMATDLGGKKLSEEQQAFLKKALAFMDEHSFELTRLQQSMLGEFLSMIDLSGVEISDRHKSFVTDHLSWVQKTQETVRLEVQLTGPQQSIVDEYLAKGYDREQDGREWLELVGNARAFHYAEGDMNCGISANLRSLTKEPKDIQISELDLPCEEVPIRFISKKFVQDGRTYKHQYQSNGATYKKKEDAVAAMMSSDETLAKHDEGNTVTELLSILLGEKIDDVGYDLYRRGNRLGPYSLRHLFIFFSEFRCFYLNAERGSRLYCEQQERLRDLDVQVSVRCASKKDLAERAQQVHEYELSNEINHGLKLRHQHFRDNLEFFWKVYQSLPIEFWGRYLRITLSSNSGTYGWPDITQANGTNIKFLEVKYADKLLPTQIDWILNVAKPLGLKVEILQVKKVN